MGSGSDFFWKSGPERFEPSSRIILIGEQPNPWELLHPQDMMGRHRCQFVSNYFEDRTISSPFRFSKGVGVLAILLLRESLTHIQVRSLYGVNSLLYERLPTVLPSSLRFGVHRYKPIFTYCIRKAIYCPEKNAILHALLHGHPDLLRCRTPPSIWTLRRN